MPFYSLFIGPSQTPFPASITHAGQIPDGSQSLYFRKLWAVEKKPFVTASQSPASASWVCGGRACKEAWTGWEPRLNADVSPESLWLLGCTGEAQLYQQSPTAPCVGRPASTGAAEWSAGQRGLGVELEDNGVSFSSRRRASFLWTLFS